MLKKFVLTFDNDTPVAILNQYSDQLGFEFPINNGAIEMTEVEKEI